MFVNDLVASCINIIRLDALLPLLFLSLVSPPSKRTGCLYDVAFVRECFIMSDSHNFDRVMRLFMRLFVFRVCVPPHPLHSFIC